MTMSLLSHLFGPKTPAKAQTARAAQFAHAAPAPASRARPVRVQAYREACITYASGYSRKGVVMDYTDTGVRIRFPNKERLPGIVKVNAGSLGLEGDADVIWQKDTEAGLRLRR